MDGSTEWLDEQLRALAHGLDQTAADLAELRGRVLARPLSVTTARRWSLSDSEVTSRPRRGGVSVPRGRG